MHRLTSLALLLSLATSAASLAAAEELPPIPPIKRLLPPPGIEIPADVRKELEAKVAELTPRINQLGSDYRYDVAVFTKAVDFALRHGEFYDKKDFDKARWALAQAEERLAQAEQRKAPWKRQSGLVARGLKSSIDDSIQPYGVVVPEDYDFKKPLPLCVFLHGRGDKQTDLHFLYERAHKAGEIVPRDAIVIHPFGRHCVGFKSAGEVDVLDAIAAATLQYPRAGKPVLVGFSMGGAGAWHIGAHYPNVFQAVSPGAGFVDVARYQKLNPEAYPPSYEQLLWGVYDVPAYTRNLFNVEVVAYSGELDKQKAAADIMAEAFRAEGRELRHLIGPQTEHKYHPETKRELLQRLQAVVAANRSADPTILAPRACVQTRTVRYGSGGWLILFGMERHWEDARLDGVLSDGQFTVTTKNATHFQIEHLGSPQPKTVSIDGQTVEVPPARDALEQATAHFVKQENRWQWSPAFLGMSGDILRGKNPGMQGPIDDAFLSDFVVVLPSGKAAHPRVQQWIDFEVEHLRQRWAALFRADLPTKRDVDVTLTDIGKKHIICFGDPASNTVIARAVAKLPLVWTHDKLEFGGQAYDPATHVPLMIYPNPLKPANAGRFRKYIVLNSGPTFREAHDRTNSLQNPKLPDWAIVDITTPPDAFAPGKVIAADFFDEQWKVK